MPAQLQFFDMAVSTTPPNGHLEPLPLTLGPNWQPNDIRLMLISASGSGSQSTLMMPMDPDPPTGFAAAYSLNATRETYGAYWRRLAPGATDASVRWPKPPGWRHFMHATLTVRGVSPTTNPTAGPLGVTYTTGDSTGTTAAVSSVSVPSAGTMLLFLGNIAAPSKSPWPQWAVSMGVPTGWTHLVATDKSGDTFYEYGTDPAIVVVGKSFAAAGSTGTVNFPTAHGSPAFAGMWVFLTPGADVSATIAAA